MSQMKYKFNNWNTAGLATDLAGFTTRFEGEIHELQRKAFPKSFYMGKFPENALLSLKNG